MAEIRYLNEIRFWTARTYIRRPKKTANDLLDDLRSYYESNRSQLPSGQKVDWWMRKDPLALWAAIDLCHERQIVFPDWIQRDLACIAKTFLKWVRRPPAKGSIPVQVAKILGFGYGSPFSHWRAMNSSRALFLRYEAIRFKGANRAATILEDLANETCKSVSSLRRYLDSFSRYFGKSCPDDLVATRLKSGLDIEPHTRVAEPEYAHGLAPDLIPCDTVVPLAPNFVVLRTKRGWVRIPSNSNHQYQHAAESKSGGSKT
jgi:hypothetical protein